MAEKVTGIKDDFRELTPEEIGNFVRLARRTRETKRSSLAQDAGVSEKLLERP